MSIPTPVVIDISEWQAPSSINYDKLAKSIDAVIIRVQYGSNYVDKHYKTHIAEFKKRGIPIAVYAWVRGSSLSDMETEAKDFYARAKAYDPAFWWLDVEEKSMGDMRNGVEKYRAKLKALGAKKVGVYVANHLFRSFNLNLAPFDGVWIPTYGSNNGQYNGSNPTATSNYDIHQYTSKGKRNGYSGDLDLNRIVRKDLAYFFGGASKSQYYDKPGWYTFIKDDTLYTSPSFGKDKVSGIKVGKGTRFYADEVTTNPSGTAKRGVILKFGKSGKRYFTLNKDYVKPS